jgi:hypothetical protein
MAFTEEQLKALEEAYAAGVLTVRYGDRSYTYDSLEALWDAIQRIRRELQGKRKFRSGTAGYRRFP